MVEDSVKVIVRRPTGMRDVARKYIIELDGIKVGQIAAGSELELTTTPGRHTVRAKIDWSGSREVVFESEGPSIVNVVVQAKSVPSAILDIFTRTKWIDITVTVG